MTTVYRLSRRGTLLLPALVFAGLMPFQRQGSVPTDSTYSRVISPTVVLTSFSTQEGKGPMTIKLLVLWRGSPGWFLRKGPRGSEGRATSDRTYERIEYGGQDLRVEIDNRTRIVRIQDKHVALKPADANVIFVDSVDAPSGPVVVSTTRIEPTLPNGHKQIETALGRSSEIVSFLRCDLKVGNPQVQVVIDRTCAVILGKERVGSFD